MTNRQMCRLINFIHKSRRRVRQTLKKQFDTHVYVAMDARTIDDWRNTYNIVLDTRTLKKKATNGEI